MAATREVYRRDAGWWLVAYFLARAGRQRDGKSALPPGQLRVSTWNEAYEVFFDSLGGGRTAKRFRNSLKNARDTFDAHVAESGRTGWRTKDLARTPSPLSTLARAVLADWHERSDEELWEQVEELITSVPEPESLGDGTFELVESGPSPEVVDAAGEDLDRTSLARRKRRSRKAKEVGDAGEAAAMAYLAKQQNVDADSLDHHAKRGSVPGYDISYLDLDGREHFVEVKATMARTMTSFELTANERRASERYPDEFELMVVTEALSARPVVTRISDFSPLLSRGRLRAEPSVWLVSGFRAG